MPNPKQFIKESLLDLVINDLDAKEPGEKLIRTMLIAFKEKPSKRLFLQIQFHWEKNIFLHRRLSGLLPFLNSFINSPVLQKTFFTPPASPQPPNIEKNRAYLLQCARDKLSEYNQLVSPQKNSLPRKN